MSDVLDEGPFFHGTKADLRVGDLLTAGFRSNYRPDVVMNHIYFTALPDGAGLAAELAAGEAAPRVYAVEPTGAFEDDPNVTDKKFPGNPTRSYRSRDPLRIVGEVSRRRKCRAAVCPETPAPRTTTRAMGAPSLRTAIEGPTDQYHTP